MYHVRNKIYKTQVLSKTFFCQLIIQNRKAIFRNTVFCEPRPLNTTLKLSIHIHHCRNGML